MKLDRIPAGLDEAQAAMASLLHWPRNLGVEMRMLRLRTRPETRLLVVFMRGLADEELVRLWALDPLQRLALERPETGRLTPDLCEQILPAVRLRTVNRMPEAVDAVLEGATLLIFDGSDRITVLETRKTVAHPVGKLVSENPHKDMFGTDLVENVALLRSRLRNPALVAEMLDRPAQSPATVVVIYLDGETDSNMVRKVRDWAQGRMQWDILQRGRSAGVAGVLGLLPEICTSPWPDKVAALLTAGYVAVMTDRIRVAYVAPVTTTSLLYGPADDQMRRPMAVVVRYARIALSLIILTAPATVVALKNYHQELIPTPFMLSMASRRENAAFPTIGEVLILQLLQEMLREATFRLPLRISPGAAMITGLLLCLLLHQSGIVGAAPALASVLVAFATFGLSSFELINMLRVWQYLMIFGAAVFGLYGLAAVEFLFAAYLSQAQSFDVPYISETGVLFTAPGRKSSEQLTKGGNAGDESRAVR